MNGYSFQVELNDVRRNEWVNAHSIKDARAALRETLGAYARIDYVCTSAPRSGAINVCRDHDGDIEMNGACDSCGVWAIDTTSYCDECGTPITRKPQMPGHDCCGQAY